MRQKSAGALEKALDEDRRLLRRYKIAKKAQFKTMCADPEHGDKLRKFSTALNQFAIEDGSRFARYVTCEAADWLRATPEVVRCMALEIISARIVYVRMRAGLVPFSDPLPGQKDDLFRVCKQELGL